MSRRKMIIKNLFYPSWICLCPLEDWTACRLVRKNLFEYIHDIIFVEPPCHYPKQQQHKDFKHASVAPRVAKQSQI